MCVDMQEICPDTGCRDGRESESRYFDKRLASRRGVAPALFTQIVSCLIKNAVSKTHVDSRPLLVSRGDFRSSKRRRHRRLCAHHAGRWGGAVGLDDARWGVSN